MANYPALHKLFDGKQDLEDDQREELRTAITKALASTIVQRANISELAGEVRKCVEGLRLYPKSLEGNAVARDTLIDMLNNPAVRPIVEMIWSRVKEAGFPGGTVMMD